MDIYEQLKEQTKLIEADLIAFRRKLHECPELCMEEYKTSEYIAEELKQIEGMEVRIGLAGGTGVMGILWGNHPGKCIALRADIDALPVEENNDLSFKSKHPGRMHACGHDGHATWIVGAAKLLGSLHGEFPGVVKFIFQPGEERGRGAIEMIRDDHVLEEPVVDMAFAAHAWPSVPSGKIGIARRYAFGCPGGFEFTIQSKGGHGSWPHKAVNPIMIASQICMTLPRIISEKIDAVEPRVISVGSIHAGKEHVGNIIPDSCCVSGTVRSTKAEVLRQLLGEIEHVVKYNCEMSGASYTMNKHFMTHPVKNNSELRDLCKKCAGKMIGEDNVYIIEEDNLGGENFAEFCSRVPAAYMFMGIKKEGEEPFDLHSPKFMLDESVLARAAQVFAALVFEANEC